MDGLTVDEGPRFSSDDHALQAAVAGHGVAIGSLILARPEIEAGLLVHPFGPVIEGESYHMPATPANMACADVRAVCAWLVESVACFAAAEQLLTAAHPRSQPTAQSPPRNAPHLLFYIGAFPSCPTPQPPTSSTPQPPPS